MHSQPCRSRPLILALSLVLVAGFSLADPPVSYVDKSDETLIDYSGQPRNASTLDHNNDGELDLILSRVADYGMLWRGNNYTSAHVPKFQLSLEDLPNPPAPGTTGFQIADYDNDGWPDVFAPAQQNSRLYRNTGGAFTDVTTTLAIGNQIDDAIGGSWGDYDGDGFVDLLVLDYGPFGDHPWGSTIQHLLRNLSGGAPAPGAFAFVRYFDATANSALWADFDGDRDLDLLLPGSEPLPVGYPPPYPTRYYLNNGDGTFSDGLNRIDHPDDIWNFTCAATVDVDNDGDLDVPYVSSSYAWGYLENDGNGSFVNHHYASFSPDDPISDLAVLDYDLDGYQDLVFCENSYSSAELFVLGNRSSPWGRQFVDETATSGIGGTANFYGLAAANFYPGDGYTDLYLGRAATEPFYYKAQAVAGQPQNNWVSVRLQSLHGANSRSCLGTTVKVQAGSLTQMQAVDGGSGRSSQHDRDLVFGLGQQTGPTVEIRWPSGRVQSESLTLNSLNVIEDDSPVVLDATVSAHLVYHFDTGEQDWVFEWETSHTSTASLDVVTILTDQIEARCLPSETELVPGMAGVIHDIEQTVSGTYQHTLTWSDVPCVARCNVKYRVGSGIDAFTSKSGGHTLQIPVCGISR